MLLPERVALEALATWTEKLLHQFGTLGSQDSFFNAEAMVQEFGIRELKFAADAAKA